MSKSNKKMENGAKLRLIMIAAVIIVAVVYGSVFYLNHYYHATQKAQDAMRGTSAVMVEKEEKYYKFSPDEETDCGIIFYPGGKVEETAYAPLMEQLAEAGYEVYLMRMPFRLAVFDMDAADQVAGKEKTVKRWYLMGHSLGGAMAASYAAKHADEFCGLALLGAYSTADLTDSRLSVLSIYGSEDGVLNRRKYEKYKKNLPENYTEYVIEGGNHAGYGNYGEQKGDGCAAISDKEQKQQVVDQVIAKWGGKNGAGN